MTFEPINDPVLPGTVGKVFQGFLGAFLFWLLASLGVSLGEGEAASEPKAWEPMSRIEAAAKQEKKLVVYSAPGHATPEAQEAIGQLFEKKYGINIEWVASRGSEMAPRILTEQRTQQPVADIAMSGIAGVYVQLKPKGYLAPILAPSAMEKGVWRLDPAAAMPKERDWLYIFMSLTPGFFINTKLVPPGDEPKSYQDLLLPKWKGKVVLQNPPLGGTGSGWFRATYKKLGLDYMRALVKQVALVANTNDVPDAVARGQYGVGISASVARGRELVQQGAPARYRHPKEGSHLAAQGVMLVANPSHPNAAKLFLQWFFTKEGQSVYAPKQNGISVRKDIPQDYLPPDERYTDGDPFLMGGTEDFGVERNEELSALMRQIFQEGK